MLLAPKFILKNEAMNYFDSIYQCAKEGYTEDLDRVLQLTPCIDERKQGTLNITAAAQLVLDGNIEAAKLLIARGANLLLMATPAMDSNQMGPVLRLPWPSNSRDYSLLQARQRAHSCTQEEMQDIWNQGLHPNQAEVSYIAQGAALAGNEALVNFLMKAFGTTSCAEIVKYYIFNGHKEHASRLITAHKISNSPLVWAAALSHNKVLLEQLKPSRGLDEAYIIASAAGFAEGGYDEEALASFELIMGNSRKKQHSEAIAAAAAKNGHYKLVKVLCGKYPEINLNVLMWAAKEGGHPKYFAQLQEKMKPLQSRYSSVTRVTFGQKKTTRWYHHDFTPSAAITSTETHGFSEENLQLRIAMQRLKQENQRLRQENQRLSEENQQLKGDNWQLTTGLDALKDYVSSGRRSFGQNRTSSTVAQTPSVADTAGFRLLTPPKGTQVRASEPNSIPEFPPRP